MFISSFVTWLLASSATQFLLLTFICLVAAYYFYSSRHYGIFKQNGIPGPTPKPFVGNLFGMTGMFHTSDSRLLERYGGNIAGHFEGLWPVLLVANPEMLRQIMIKEFASFPDRRALLDQGPMRTALTAARGDQWKRIRSVITPTFSSRKLRRLLPLLQHCTDYVSTDLAQNHADKDVECKAYFSSFTMDVAGTAFFGVELNALKEPNSPYVQHAKKLFDFSLSNIAVLVGFLFPFLSPVLSKLGFFGLSTDSLNFLFRTIDTVIHKRKAEGAKTVDHDGKKPATQRRKDDFLDLLLTSLQDEEEEPVRDNALTAGETDNDAAVFVVQATQNKPPVNGFTSDENVRNQNHSNVSVTTRLHSKRLSNEEIMAQAVIFLLAAYETTSTTISFFINALAVHQKEQDRVREEVNSAYDKSADTNLTYEQVNNGLPYLDQCLQETLRFWPPGTRTERVCIRDTDVEGVHIPAEVVVAIPIYYLHHNEKYWLEPEEWKPDRFAPEARDDIAPFTYLPFGQGPRNCVGMRFALLQMKVLLAALIRQFRILPVEGKTEVNPVLAEKAGVLQAKNGIWVRFENI